MTDTLTWTRDGLTYTATPPVGETKAKGTKWTAEDARKHPRDSEGKFIETGAEVRILGVGLGRVLSDDAGPGKTAVRLANGQTRNVPNGSLTVTKRPDGSKPTGKPEELKKPAPVKPAAPRSAPAGRADTGGEYPQISTHGDLRRYWESGGEGNPDLPDGQRDFLRHAAANANEYGLSKGGGLAIVQGDEGGPWQISDHHGRKIIGDLPTEERAEELASRLESLADADGNRFDWNGPGFTDRAKAFRTADGETLPGAVQRLIGEAASGGKKPDSGAGRGGVDVAPLREVQEWKPLTKKPGMNQLLREGRPRIRETAEELADAIEQGADAHTVIAAYDRFSAAVNDASNVPSKLDYRSDRPGGERDFAQILRTRGRDAYLQWRANAPDAANPKGRRFSSVSEVREHLAAGGDEPTPLSHARKDRGVRETAEKIADDSVLVGGGTFIAIRDPQSSKWNLHNSADGMPLIPRTDFDTWAEAGEVADALKTIDHDWDHPRHWFTDGPYPIAQVQDVLSERAEKRRRDGGAGTGGPEPSPEPSGDKEPVAPQLDTPEAVRAYWESGGEGDERLSSGQRSMMKHAAKRNVEIRLSDDGGLVLARQQKSGPWRVLNLRGEPTLGGEIASLVRARDLARRLERDVVDADGVPLDWNDVDEDRRLAFRTDRGEAFEDALDRVYKEHLAASDAAGGKRGQQGITKVGDAVAVRAYWAQGGRAEPDAGVPESKWEAHRQSMRWKAESVDDLKVSPGGQFILTRSRKGLPWEIATVENFSVPGDFSSEKQAREFAVKLETQVIDADGKPFDWGAPNIGQRTKAFRSPAGETLAEVFNRIQRGEPAPTPRPTPEPAGGKETPEPKPGPGVADRAGRFATMDEVRDHWRKLAEAPDATEEHANYLRAMADDPERSKKLFLSPGGTLVMNNFDARTVEFTHAASGLSLAGTHGGNRIWSEWGGRKAHLELARRLETRMLDGDGNQLDWSNPDLRELMRTWRSQYGENGLAAAWRIKGEWDHENGKDTIASRDYAMVWENPDRPAATGRSAYGDEVKPGDILSVSQAGRWGVDKRVTAVDTAGWGKYRLTYEDDTSEVVARNERLLRSGLERYVTNADGDVIGENVPVGVLKPGDRVQFTAEGGSTFNVADQATLKQGGIDGYRSVQVEGTLVGEADPDGRGRTRMVLKGVVVRQGRASVTLPNQQRDREGRATTYAVPASVTRLGKTSASDADRDAARERRLAEEAELDRAVMADRARKRVLSAYRFAVPEVPRIDQGELERRRGELADADRNAVDAAAARLQVMAANVPATLSGPNDNRQAMVAAYAAAISERMEALGYLHPAPNYRLGWETADRLRNRTAGAWERALAGDRLDEDALRGVVDMAAALGNRDLVDAVATERERRNRQPNPEGLNDEALTAALTAVDEPTGRAAGELLRLLAITDPDETPRPQTVRGWWLDFHEATQRAMQRDDISDPTADWLQRVSDDIAARMRRRHHRPITSENVERLAEYEAMDIEQLRRVLDGMRYESDAYDDLMEELERRGYNDSGYRPYGSPDDLTDGKQPSRELVGTRVALHDGQGGWIEGFLHQRRSGWVLSRSPDDPDASPVGLQDRRNRTAPFVMPVRPGHPALADLNKSEYSVAELDGEINRLAPQIQALWAADRRRGDAEFDRLFARYELLLRERQGRPDPEPEPIRQDEALFDETGTPTEDATPEEPRGTVVKASTLAVGDRIDAGQVEQVTRIQDMVFATVRDGDDRRTVKGYPPDADVRRLTASGERVPEPVTVADVPSGDLRADDRVLLARHDGRYLPATVTGVSVEGDVRVLDVRYDDGSTQTVLVDRGEVLPRLGGPEAGVQPDPADEEEADEPPAEAEPVAAGTLKPGDRFMFNNRLDVYEVMSVDAGAASLGVRVRRERDGAEFDFGLGKTQTVFKAPRPGPQPDGEGDGTGEAEQRPVVKPLPDGTASARPVLYTYQRRNLNWLGLEASQDETVQQAALRVRDRMPLSADQAAALAGAVRAQAATEKPGRQRSMERLAYTLDAAAAQARGLRKPRKPEGRGTPFKARATNLVEGDVVALPGAKGRARVGKVTGKRTLMGGRLVELDIEYGDGSTERRLLNRDTDSYVLPDLPDDVPLPPEPAPSPSAAGPLSLAGHDYARSLGKLDDQIREYMSITASTEVTAKTFKNRDAAARALTGAFDRTVGGVLAERSHENLRYPTGLHGRALPPEATGVDQTLLRSRYAMLLAERLPDAGPVSREQLIDAAQQLHVRHDAAADMPYYEGIARTTLDKHPQGTLEHIIPGRLQPGDIIALGGDEYEVDAVTHRQSDMAVQVTLTPTGQDPNQGYRAISTEGLMSHDGGPSVVRLERGPASADQPWDAVMEPDGPPVRITGDQINIGDRLMVENRYNRGTIGMVVRLETATGDTANREVTIRMDGSRNTTLTISRGDHPGLFRLVEADEDIAERLRREQIERQRRRLTATISQTMATTVNNVHTATAGRGMLGVGTSEWHTLHEIDQVDLQSIYRRNDPADTIIRVLGVTDAVTRDEMRRRLDPIIRDLGIAARDRVRESVRLAKPLPGEDAADARRRVLRQISDQPPAVGEDFTAPAAALAALKEALDGTDSDGARILSDLPELGPVRDLRKRISAYRAALGDGANFGKARVRRSVMADTTLADLEAGKVPAVETVDVAVPDRAADGGPGEAAMRHLEIVRAAGKDLDTEVQRRMDAAGVAELEAQLPGARARADMRLADIIDMENTMAREAGFQSLMDLRGAVARASDPSERQRLSDLRESIDARVMAEKSARRQRVDDLTRRIAAERRRAALAVLGEVRDDGMGGVRIDWHDKSKAKGNKQLTERSELVKALRFAEDSYPRAWLERFRDHATKKGQVWKVGKILRGHYQDRAKLINLSDESVRVEGAPKMGRVATHEMGHGMEQAIPGMLAAQNAFLWSRTSTGDIGSRTRQSKTEIFGNEYGYKDEFPEHYTGKDYVDRYTGEHYAFEVFTTGIESLMAGSNYLDDDFRQWMLGVMALLGTPEQSRRPASRTGGKPERTAPGGYPRTATGRPAVPTTDAEYQAYTERLEETLGRALADGLATDQTYTVNGDGQTYLPERAAQHKAIVDELYAKYADVPAEGKAVIAGGLGGAGKSTVLTKFAGFDLSQYATINPDDIKEAMATRGMVPTVEGLSPMEAAPLVHEESGLIANLLAQRLYREKKNVIWDITMSARKSVEKRLREMRQAGYTDFQAVFVDIPIETSVQRALARHRRGAEAYANGKGHGGRYVPPRIIRANATAGSSSANRTVFESLQDQFTAWQLWDNSVSGRDPQKIASS